jgi:hypothetical protein
MSLIAIYFLTNTNLMAQSIIKRIQVRDHRNNETRQVFKIDVLETAKNDGKYRKAKQNQGVIGNDFYADFKIGMAQNDNPWQISGTATDYQPIDGFKRTLTGKLLELRYNDGIKDDDFNFIIEVDPKHELLVKHQNNIKRVNHGGINNTKYPWNVVYGEIDVFDDWHKYYKSPYSAPQELIDNVSLYGPWVLELYDSDEIGKHHNNYHEIHPAEQVWWVKKRNNGDTFNFIMANDASGRFNGRGDYTAYKDTKVENLWVNTPLNGVFAIAFSFNPKVEKLNFRINTICQSGVKPTTTEPRLHYLTNQRDTLVSIEEVGEKMVAIDFENVGFLPRPLWEGDQTGVVSGFLLLKSTVYREEGNLKLEVIETRTRKPQPPVNNQDQTK